MRIKRANYAFQSILEAFRVWIYELCNVLLQRSIIAVLISTSVERREQHFIILILQFNAEVYLVISGYKYVTAPTEMLVAEGSMMEETFSAEFNFIPMFILSQQVSNF